MVALAHARKARWQGGSAHPMSSNSWACSLRRITLIVLTPRSFATAMTWRPMVDPAAVWSRYSPFGTFKVSKKPHTVTAETKQQLPLGKTSLRGLPQSCQCKNGCRTYRVMFMAVCRTHCHHNAKAIPDAERCMTLTRIDEELGCRLIGHIVRHSDLHTGSPETYYR